MFYIVNSSVIFSSLFKGDCISHVTDEIAYMYDAFPDFSLVFLFLRLLCIGILYSFLHYTLCLVYLDCLFAFCFFFTSGASSPEWVQTHR
jgi:hypothetical protein